MLTFSSKACIFIKEIKFQMFGMPDANYAAITVIACDILAS